tara:strand:+ start:598 stop:816 length:219 start_codon:yes stop_codon:yes gene_type:complete
MFKIFCVICFAQMGSLKHTLCFQSSIPLTFTTKEECVLERDKIIDYMNQDLLERNVSIMFSCKDTATQKINI